MLTKNQGRLESVVSYYNIILYENRIHVIHKRINLAGCVYHVICRAEHHNVVFTEDKDKELFLSI